MRANQILDELITLEIERRSLETRCMELRARLGLEGAILPTRKRGRPRKALAHAAAELVAKEAQNNNSKPMLRDAIGRRVSLTAEQRRERARKASAVARAKRKAEREKSPAVGSVTTKPKVSSALMRARRVNAAKARAARQRNLELKKQG